MDDFKKLFNAERVSVERFVRFRLNVKADADGVLQTKQIYPLKEIFRELETPFRAQKDFLLDIVGRYTVTIGGKSYDTVCVMDIETYNCGVVSEQFLDKNGKTILWRRYNRDDWAIERYKKHWSEQLTQNNRLTVIPL